VRPRIVLLVTLVTLIAGSAQALAKGKHPSPKPPTAAQMRAAVQRAERSKYLWATVNICNTKRHPHAIGVRGQMPALGFPALLQMTVHLKYWSTAKSMFLPIPHVARNLSLGVASTGLHQGGFTFTFTPPVLLSGQIDFRWSVHGHTLGRTTRSTGHGFKGVDGGDPPGHSASTCTMT
jgi:hypothetical protein